MARFTMDYYSQSLAMATSLNVVVPATESPPPVLYLLHGLSDDHTIWLRRTSAERYADAAGVALVMPGVARSYYTDMVSGPRYWTFLSEEVPEVVHRFFRLSASPQKTFVAGLSMGGYGALKLAFHHPDRFAAVGSFSGAVDPDRLISELRESDDPADIERLREYTWIFGSPPEISGTERDLFALAARVASDKEEDERPRIYLSCGAEDFLIEHNRRFRSHLSELGLETEYREEPGTHEWGFWDRHLRLFLRWLGERRLRDK